jgi:hypothetical protein
MRRKSARAWVEDRVSSLTGLVLLVLPSVAFAEVMDKEPSLRRIWTWALCAGIGGLVGWPIAWPLGLAAALFGVPFFLGLFGEITDPHIGPAIVNEAGRGYVYQSCAALALFVLLHAVGVSLRVHQRRRAKAVQHRAT